MVGHRPPLLFCRGVFWLTAVSAGGTAECARPASSGAQPCTQQVGNTSFCGSARGCTSVWSSPVLIPGNLLVSKFSVLTSHIPHSRLPGNEAKPSQWLYCQDFDRTRNCPTNSVVLRLDLFIGLRSWSYNGWLQLLTIHPSVSLKRSGL